MTEKNYFFQENFLFFILQNNFFAEISGGIFSPYILRNSTHFVTTREMISLECMDCLWDTDVKIISALDDGIFDGEPVVDWEKIF